jgi:hypothetical protein
MLQTYTVGIIILLVVFSNIASSFLNKKAKDTKPLFKNAADTRILEPSSHS